jgi:hypothetical protein
MLVLEMEPRTELEQEDSKDAVSQGQGVAGEDSQDAESQGHGVAGGLRTECQAGEDSQDAEGQGSGVAGEDSQDAEGQRSAMMVSDELISPKSHRQTSLLGTDIHSGTGTEPPQ